MSSLVHQPNRDVVKTVRQSLQVALILSALPVIGLAVGFGMFGESIAITALDPWSASFWAQKLFHQGPIPYMILYSFLCALVYILLIWRKGGFPVRDRDSEVAADEVAAKVGSLKSSPARSYAPFTAGISGSSPIQRRFTVLEPIYELSQDKEAAQAANDRLTAAAEANLAHTLSRLVYAEWVLPILGFIGTVWGVIAAVYGLSGGIEQLFRDGSLTTEVVTQFRGGFDGLALAFDTTLFGLVALAIVGSLHFMMRRANVHQILIVDEACRTATDALQDGDLIRRGFFETDDKGKLLADAEGRPILRWQQWMDQLRAGFLETTAEGEVAVGADGKPLPRLARWLLETDEHGDICESEGGPVLRWQQWMDDMRAGALETGEDGQLARDDRGQPIPRWKNLADLLLAEFFYLQDGQVLRDESGAPRSKAGSHRAYMQRFASLVALELYELGGEPDSPVMGYLEGEDEPRPLRSSAERRFQLVQNHLYVIQALLLGDRRAGRPDDSPAAVSGQQVLEANEAPCNAVAVTGGRYAIVREKDPGFGDYSIHTGTIEPYLEGRFRRARPVAEIPARQRPNGLAIRADRIALTSPSVVETYGWDPTESAHENPLDSGAANIVSDAVALVHTNGVDEAIFLTREGDRTRVLGWQASGETVDFRPVYDDNGKPLSAVAASGLGLAWATKGLAGAKLTVYSSDSGTSSAELGGKPTSLAISPRSVWVGEEDGSLSEFARNGTRLERTARMLRDSRRPDWVAVTAGGEIATARRGEKSLHFLSASDSSRRVIEYASPISALAASPSGESLIVGCDDGSAYFWDVRGPLAPPREEPTT